MNPPSSKEKTKKTTEYDISYYRQRVIARNVLKKWIGSKLKLVNFIDLTIYDKYDNYKYWYFHNIRMALAL